ncbi:MerR family transcriptional regulator [Patulibacter americanus]|uniref:transcriptional regulator FtsR n=1 Tax=Patulibacter americanus TaxID=588672 RepID=UPI0003B5C5C4|nr:MerR family transcriptional regulator [Patulibacter americanus]
MVDETGPDPAVLDGRAPEAPAGAGERPAAPARAGRPLTIGQVCKLLVGEFPDISISKIRYLEEQKLLQPRRTSGGYRLFSTEDMERLRTILRLQRDEFLPLRVIRQELAAGRGQEPRVSGPGGAGEGEDDEPDAHAHHRTGPIKLRGGGTAFHTLEQLCDDTRATPALVKELRDFGVVQGTPRDGAILFDDDEREIVRAAVELSHYGVGGRHLRVLRSSADREGALLEQLLGPSLRSRSAERRAEAVDALETLAATTMRLKHLLLVRDLRRLVP